MNETTLLRTTKSSRLALLGAGIIAALFTSCKSRSFYEPPTVYGARGKSIFAPPGMVYIPSGTIVYKSGVEGNRKVSLSPFFMDATEVTNYQYREFVNWVADSIAVTEILKDDSYFLKQKSAKSTKSKGKSSSAPSVESQNGNVIRFIDWEKVQGKGGKPLWQSSDPAIQSKLLAANFIVEEGNRFVLNKDMIKFNFSYRPANGPNAGKFVKEQVSVVPESNVWVNDFPNSQMEIMSDNYYHKRTFDHYPVVGVNWKQARAFTTWRGKTMLTKLLKNNYLKAYDLAYNLPSEAQWQYAATGSTHPGEGVDSLKKALASYTDKKSKKKKVLVNFKQNEGDYAQDGSTFTLPVKTYAPNDFGLYNMGGNVAEWTLDAFSPSAIEFVFDLNPVLQYDADDKAPMAMRRKVVRGGSWKDSGKLLDLETRNYELQDAAHSYIGFRCVMPAIEILTDQVRTRKRSDTDSAPKSKKTEKKQSTKKDKDLKSASIN